MTNVAVLPIQSRPLQDRALLTRLHIQCPTFRKTDSKIAREVAEQKKSSADMHTHRRRILAKNALADIQKVISAARDYHLKNTLPWEDEGVRARPTMGFDEYMEVMRDYERQFYAAVDKFEPVYPTLIEEARPLLGDAFNERDYPPPLLIRSKFGFAIKSSNISDDFRCSVLDPEQESRIRAEVQARTQETLAETVRHLYQQTYEHVEHMVERLRAYNEREEKPAEERTRDGIFRDTLVTNIKEFVDRLPVLNLTGDPKLEEMRVKLHRQLCAHSPEDLRQSPATRNHVLAQAEAIQAAVSELI